MDEEGKAHDEGGDADFLRVMADACDGERSAWKPHCARLRYLAHALDALLLELDSTTVVDAWDSLRVLQGQRDYAEQLLQEARSLHPQRRPT